MLWEKKIYEKFNNKKDKKLYQKNLVSSCVEKNQKLFFLQKVLNFSRTEENYWVKNTKNYYCSEGDEGLKTIWNIFFSF